MKVRLEKEYKKYITLAEAPIVREIISSLKEDTSTVEEYAEMAVRAAYNNKTNDIEILKASAKISKNCRVWNAFTENSEELDVWIEATAYVNHYNNSEFGYKIIIIGAYLSDIWQISCENYREMASHMYIRRFKEAK